MLTKLCAERSLWGHRAGWHVAPYSSCTQACSSSGLETVHRLGFRPMWKIYLASSIGKSWGKETHVGLLSIWVLHQWGIADFHVKFCTFFFWASKTLPNRSSYGHESVNIDLYIWCRNSQGVGWALKQVPSFESLLRLVSDCPLKRCFSFFQWQVCFFAL